MIPPEPLYLPLDPGPYRMAMGLTACDRAHLIEIDEHYPTQIAERRTLVAQLGREVVAAEPGAEPECAELLARVADALSRRYPAAFAWDQHTLHNRLTGETWPLGADPLQTAALLVQEDLCLLRLQGSHPVLVAGAVCFPSGWRLRDKTRAHAGERARARPALSRPARKQRGPVHPPPRPGQAGRALQLGPAG